MCEYVLRAREEDAVDDFRGLGVPYEDWRKAFRPANTPSEVIDGWGNLRLRIEDSDVSFSDEFVGIQIVFEDTGMSDDRVDAIAEEIRQQAESYTGRRAEIIRTT